MASMATDLNTAKARKGAAESRLLKHEKAQAGEAVMMAAREELLAAEQEIAQIQLAQVQHAFENLFEVNKDPHEALIASHRSKVEDARKMLEAATESRLLHQRMQANVSNPLASTSAGITLNTGHAPLTAEQVAARVAGTAPASPLQFQGPSRTMLPLNPVAVTDALMAKLQGMPSPQQQQQQRVQGVVMSVAAAVAGGADTQGAYVTGISTRGGLQAGSSDKQGGLGQVQQDTEGGAAHASTLLQAPVQGGAAAGLQLQAAGPAAWDGPSALAATLASVQQVVWQQEQEERDRQVQARLEAPPAGPSGAQRSRATPGKAARSAADKAAHKAHRRAAQVADATTDSTSGTEAVVAAVAAPPPAGPFPAPRGPGQPAPSHGSSGSLLRDAGAKPTPNGGPRSAATSPSRPAPSPLAVTHRDAPGTIPIAGNGKQPTPRTEAMNELLRAVDSAEREGGAPRNRRVSKSMLVAKQQGSGGASPQRQSVSDLPRHASGTSNGREGPASRSLHDQPRQAKSAGGQREGLASTAVTMDVDFQPALPHDQGRKGKSHTARPAGSQGITIVQQSNGKAAAPDRNGKAGKGKAGPSQPGPSKAAAGPNKAGAGSVREGGQQQGGPSRKRGRDVEGPAREEEEEEVVVQGTSMGQGTSTDQRTITAQGASTGQRASTGRQPEEPAAKRPAPDKAAKGHQASRTHKAAPAPAPAPAPSPAQQVPAPLNRLLAHQERRLSSLGAQPAAPAAAAAPKAGGGQDQGKGARKGGQGSSAQASGGQHQGSGEGELQREYQGVGFPEWFLDSARAAEERVADLKEKGYLQSVGVMANNKQEAFFIRPEPSAVGPLEPAGRNNMCTMLVACNTQDPDTRMDTNCILFDDMSKPNPRYEVYGMFVVVAAGRQLRYEEVLHKAWTENLTHGSLTVIPTKYQWFGLYRTGGPEEDRWVADSPWAYVNLYTAREDYKKMQALILERDGRHRRMRFMDFVAQCSEEDAESEFTAANILFRHPDPLNPDTEQCYDTLELKDCHPDNALFTFFVNNPIDNVPFPFAPNVPLQSLNAPLPVNYSSLYQ